MGNVGHFDVEIDAEFLLKKSKSVREVRPNLDECTLKWQKHVYLDWPRKAWQILWQQRDILQKLWHNHFQTKFYQCIVYS